MQQVAVAVLDVDEVEAGALRAGGGAREVGDQRVELGVAQHRRVAGDADARVEDRMAERDARPRARRPPASTSARCG